MTRRSSSRRFRGFRVMLIARGSDYRGPVPNLLPDPPSPFSALIFDLDGTLVDSVSAYRLAFSDALHPHGVSLDEDWFLDHAGYGASDLLRALQADFGFHFDLTDVLEGFERSYLDAVGEVRVVPEVLAIVRRHYGRVPLAVATGGRRSIVVPTLRAALLEGWFATVITIEDVQQGKPAPDLFLLAAERLGVPPRGCVVYEDSAQGLAAARAAGMAAVDVTKARTA